MFPIAGQTAGPIGLKLFVDTHGGQGVLKHKKTKKKFNIFFYGQRQALQLVIT